MELLTTVRADVAADKNARQAIAIIKKKLNAGTATYNDVRRLATRLGTATSKALGRIVGYVDDATLAEFAEVVLAPVYGGLQTDILSASKQVQEAFNRTAGFGFKAADVLPDAERIRHIVERFAEAESLDSVSFLMGEGVAQNIALGAATDSLRENARFANDAGLKTMLARTDGAACCAWCAAQCGTFTVDNVPEGFWQVHKDCSCKFEYKVRNTHTRITFSTDEQGNIRKNTVKM